MELYDRIMRVAMQMPGSYDPIKISDMLIEDANKNPDDFKMENLVAQNQEAQRLRAQIQLASFENQMMIKGQEVPATKYASPAHTQIHTEFMLSPAFQQTEDMDHKISTIFTRHVIGEMMAQEARGIQGIGAPMNEEMPQMQPQLPGQQGQATSINQGKENKSGGMKKPANKIGDVMPGLNSGGSSHLP